MVRVPTLASRTHTKLYDGTYRVRVKIDGAYLQRHLYTKVQRSCPGKRDHIPLTFVFALPVTSVNVRVQLDVSYSKQTCLEGGENVAALSDIICIFHKQWRNFLLQSQTFID